jgi:hypothetical protein
MGRMFIVHFWNEFPVVQLLAIVCNQFSSCSFFFDPSKILSTSDYVKDIILGGRQYYLKEPLSTIPKARKQLKVMWCIDRFCKIVLIVFIVKVLLSLSNFY